jgi:hypothetical protein
MQAFPQENFRLLYSSHSGVMCPPNSDAKQRGLFPVVLRLWTEAPDASKPPRRTAGLLDTENRGSWSPTLDAMKLRQGWATRLFTIIHSDEIRVMNFPSFQMN